MEISAIIAIIGVLVAITNIIVEVVKKSTWDKLPTNILALIVAQALTIASGLAYTQIEAISLTWYIVVAFVVIGFMVAYASMFGFDKLKEIMNWKKEGADNE
jgi:hypothetical protein